MVKKRRNYKVEKHWIAFNCECVVIMTEMGHRCGYVGIKEDHPLYGVGYRDNSEYLEKWREELWDGETISPEAFFDVHGGITFAGGDGEYPIEMKNIWWYGYDCGHCNDAPSIPDISNPQLRIIEQESLERWASFPNSREVRSLEYCVEECESLARQLNEIVWMPALDHQAKEELQEVMKSANVEIDKWIKKRNKNDKEKGLL